MSEESRPFLPEPEPVPAPTKSPRTVRTLVLWILLVVMFLAIWQFLSPTEPAHAQPPPPQDSSGTAVLYTLVPLVFVAAMFVVLARRLRAPVRAYADFNLSLEDAERAMAAAQFRDARDGFLDAARRFAKQPLYRAVALLRAARAQMRAGSIEDGIATLARAEKGSGLLFSSGIRSIAAAELAFAYALAGDLDVSDRWAAATRERLTKNREPRMACAATLSIAEAAVAIRRGRPADAVKLLDENWLLLRETLTANMMRIAEVVRALAEADGGIRAYNPVAERLVRIEPTLPGEFAFLGARWPEMNTFLAAHHLAAA